MKKRKSYIRGILAVAVIITGIAAAITYRIQATLPTDPESLYKRQYKRDKQLRQEVKDFVAPGNIKALFKQHEEVLETLAEKCYEDRDTDKSFDVYYIDDERYYFSVWEHKNYETSKRKKESAVKEGEYTYITEFMDYAIENKIAFCDWMLSVTTWEPVNEKKGTLLVITIYRGLYNDLYDGTVEKAKWLELYLVYSPYSNVDYSYDNVYMSEIGWMRGKKVRLTPNWYYYYRLAY